MYLFFNELEFGIFTDKYEWYIAVRNNLQSVELTSYVTFYEMIDVIELKDHHKL